MVVSYAEVLLHIPRRIPFIFKKFHLSSLLRIHIDGTAVIEIDSQSHVRILHRRTMMSHLVELIPHFGTDLTYL